MVTTDKSEKLTILAQSDAEPVAWEYKTADGWWQRISLENYKILKGSSFELRPVFDIATPRPDTSEGMIEAADAIEGLLSEWDKFCKYGSPMAKLANERVTYARKVLSDLRASGHAVTQSDADDLGDATWREFKKRMNMGTKEAIATSADRKALQSLHWHLLNRTENREVLLGIVEDALGFRPRAAGSRSGK